MKGSTNDPRVERARALLSEAQDILATLWAEFGGRDEPGALEIGMAKFGRFPPTQEEMASWEPPSRTAQGGALVYFIQADGGGFIKIGCADDPEQRLRDLQTGSPVRLCLLRVVDGGRTRERELHRRFASLRQHGEWFRSSAELVDFINGGAL